MNAYEVRVAEGHALSLSNMRQYETYRGEIVRVDTGAVAYRTKPYHEPNTARLQAARLRKNYEHHLIKHGVGFEQQEAERKANERAARDAKLEADRRVRDAAPEMLAVLISIEQDLATLNPKSQPLKRIRAAIAKAREG